MDDGVACRHRLVVMIPSVVRHSLRCRRRDGEPMRFRIDGPLVLGAFCYSGGSDVAHHSECIFFIESCLLRRRLRRLNGLLGRASPGGDGGTGQEGDGFGGFLLLSRSLRFRVQLCGIFMPDLPHQTRVEFHASTATGSERGVKPRVWEKRRGANEAHNPTKHGISCLGGGGSAWEKLCISINYYHIWTAFLK